MRQDMENITPTRLETLLELALRTSTANTDQFKDDLRYRQFLLHTSRGYKGDKVCPVRWVKMGQVRERSD